VDVTVSPLLLTIGYGKRTLDEAIALLDDHSVRYLADVRSVPWSRFRPEFAQDELKAHLDLAGIRYLYLGEELGGRPKDPSCYDARGRVDYDACRQRAAFLGGIERLRTAWTQGQRVALLCSESRPEECHSSKLLGVVLQEMGIAVQHLDEDGSVVSQEAVMGRLEGNQPSLFGDLPPAGALRSRGRYRDPEQ
jgi:uncharacterized protein (DUF488 family)